MRKKGYSALPFVAMGVFDDTVSHHTARLVFENEWANDKTVSVKKFKRTVRAGGAGKEVVAIVVRRKVAA